MDASAPTPAKAGSGAWQPFSPGGVAAFGEASLERLLLVQGLAATLAASVIVWFVISAWYPAISQAINQLPFEGKISVGQLDWRGANPVVLSENRFLAFGVDLENARTRRPFGDVRFIFERQRLTCESIAGSRQFHYPRGTMLAFNRTELLPRWGAWSLWIAILLGLGAATCLMLTWWALGLVLSIPVSMAALLLKRPASLWKCWKVSAAAQLPGAVFLTLAIAGYRLGIIDLLRLAAAFATHFALTWLYVFLASLALPRKRATQAAANPFAKTEHTNA